MNFIRGTVDLNGDQGILVGDGDVRVPLERSRAGLLRDFLGETPALLGVRHRDIEVAHHNGAGSIPARIYAVEPTGDITFVHLRLGEQILIASVEPSFRASLDETVWVTFDQDFLHLFDAQTQLALPAAPATDGVQMPVGMATAPTAAPA